MSRSRWRRTEQSRAQRRPPALLRLAVGSRLTAYYNTAEPNQEVITMAFLLLQTLCSLGDPHGGSVTICLQKGLRAGLELELLNDMEALRCSPSALNSGPWWEQADTMRVPSSAVSVEPVAPVGRPAGYLTLQQMCGPS